MWSAERPLYHSSLGLRKGSAYHKSMSSAVQKMKERGQIDIARSRYLKIPNCKEKVTKVRVGLRARTRSLLIVSFPLGKAAQYAKVDWCISGIADGLWLCNHNIDDGTGLSKDTASKTPILL